MSLPKVYHPKRPEKVLTPCHDAELQRFLELGWLKKEEPAKECNSDS